MDHVFVYPPSRSRSDREIQDKERVRKLILPEETNIKNEKEPRPYRVPNTSLEFRDREREIELELVNKNNENARRRRS